MYLHLGNETVIQIRDIIGIFDIEKTSTGQITRDFLRNAEKSLLITNVTDKLPKSFVVTQGKTEARVYISQISAATLQKRAESGRKHMDWEYSISEDRRLPVGGEGENI